MSRVFIEPDGLLLDGTPLPASELSEICVGWFPPTVRTKSGEYHLVPARQMRELADLASAQAIPFVDRDDVWSWLLEPFLDTEFSAEEQARTLALLAKNGFTADEVAALRERVHDPMYALTAATWEWAHYGLWDVLSVITDAAFRAQAFAIADRGRAQPATRDAFLRFAPQP